MLTKSLVQFVPKIRYIATPIARMLSTFETLKLTTPSEHVLHVELHRPEKRNAMNRQFFVDIRNCFKEIANEPDVRAVLLSGAGKHFTSGLDLQDYAGSLMAPGDDVGRRAFQLQGMIHELQESFFVIQKCPQPVIAAVHSACIGGGVDLICSCDIRLCTSDMWLSIKEVDIGLAADLGTLQRLPKIIGNDSLVRELAYTARNMLSDEALSAGLYSRVYPDKESMINRALELASEIASKSPVAITATKQQLNYARDHTVEEGLDYIASWNMGLLQSKDLIVAAQAFMQKQKAKFDNLSSKL